jgi:hypothetical protein
MHYQYNIAVCYVSINEYMTDTPLLCNAAIAATITTMVIRCLLPLYYHLYRADKAINTACIRSL